MPWLTVTNKKMERFKRFLVNTPLCVPLPSPLSSLFMFCLTSDGLWPQGPVLRFEYPSPTCCLLSKSTRVLSTSWFVVQPWTLSHRSRPMTSGAPTHTWAWIHSYITYVFLLAYVDRNHLIHYQLINSQHNRGYGKGHDTELLDPISAYQHSRGGRERKFKKKKDKRLKSRGWISIYLIPSPAALELKNAIVLTLTVINDVT